MDGKPGDVTALLHDLGRGNKRAVDELLPLIYEELRGLAGHFLRQERPDHTLRATALVNEAYLRLVGSAESGAGKWESRGHFYRVAAMAMRRILVDHGRRHRADKRGGDLQRVSMSHVESVGNATDIDLVALDDALNKLAGLDEQKGRVVELRFFVGLSIEETAQALEISPRTVDRDWSMARAWLFREMQS